MGLKFKVNWVKNKKILWNLFNDFWEIKKIFRINKELLLKSDIEASMEDIIPN